MAGREGKGVPGRRIRCSQTERAEGVGSWHHSLNSMTPGRTKAACPVWARHVRCRVSAQAGAWGARHALGCSPPTVPGTVPAPRGHSRTLPTWDERAAGASLFPQNKPSHPGSHSALTLLLSWKKHQFVSRQDEPTAFRR